MDEQVGIFPRQFNDLLQRPTGGRLLAQPLAKGQYLSVVPENAQETIQFAADGQELELLDGRGEHNNGWFIVRTLAQKGKLKEAVSLTIMPSYAPNWRYEPVIQVSQVGYHPKQTKRAVIEIDPRAEDIPIVSLLKINPQGGTETVKSIRADRWGEFLRYQYLHFDFSEVEEPGIYQIHFAGQTVSTLSNS